LISFSCEIQEKLNESDDTNAALQRENDAAVGQIEALTRRSGGLEFDLTCARGEVIIIYSLENAMARGYAWYKLLDAPVLSLDVTV
jgi:hypothetical protein